MPTPLTSHTPEADLEPELAHLLLIDICGYSKLLANEQVESLQELARIVRGTEAFKTAEANGKLVRVPTGDGMALLFFRSPEEPVRCALEISRQLNESSTMRVRMGIHSGPVNQIRDVNDTVNVAGPGINVAQRVMDCGDAGHILLSKHVADDLAHYRHWQPYLRDLGEFEVKHGLRLGMVNLFKDNLGNPSLPEKLQRRKRRRQSASAIVKPVRSRWSKLTWTLVWALIAIAIGSSIYLGYDRFKRSRVSAMPLPEKSIAVLPFESLSEEKENAYFGDGVQDAILSGLSKVADLKVISRTSVMQYRKEGSRNLREIAKALGVENIVEGTVQRAGNRVRVSAQLINARDDIHLWAEYYDRDLADIFVVESELAEKIVTQLKATLSPKEKSAIKEQPTNDLVAYNLYVGAKNLVDGISLRPQGKEDLLEAIDLLDRAITRDPAFLRAHCASARAHNALYFIGYDHTPTRLALAQKAVDAALKLRPDSGEAHLALAQHLLSGFRDYDRARAELAIAKRQLPNDALLFRLSANIERRQGNWDQAINEMKRAADLDPLNTSVLEQLCFYYGSVRNFEKAQEVVDRILSIAPDNTNAQITRAYIYFQWYGNSAPLHETIQSILSRNPNAAATISAAWLDLALAEHDSAAAEQALSHLPQDGCDSGAIPFPHAWCEGLVARLRGDDSSAKKAFLRARTELTEILHVQPDYPEALCALGLVDAALANKSDAIKEGRRAVELCPLTKDSVEGALLIQYLAVIYTWTGEKELALNHLELSARMPNGLSYGDLRTDPYWDSLRGDRRFEKVLNSIAPKARH